MYIDRDNENSTIQFGDYDADLIEKGEEGLTWIESTNDTDWQVDIGAAYLGGESLYLHSFR